MSGKRLLYLTSLVLCSAGLLLCGGLFLRQWREYRVGEVSYGALEEAVVSAPAVQSSQNGETEPEEETLPQVDFQALERIDPDIVGWLYCPDTVISYPVVQGEDDTYYLDHLFDGTPNSAGCLFLDSRCQGLDGANSVIYGHHMKNGTLFASLEAYQDQSYYDAHPCLYLITPEQTLTIRLFSAYVTGAEGDAWRLSFSSAEEHAAWLEGLLERSCFASDVTPQASDQVITLSTCDYSFQDARFVCHGLVQVDDGK